MKLKKSRSEGFYFTLEANTEATFRVDEKGEKRAVVIDLKKYASLWEDFYDRAMADSRKDEPRETLDHVKRRLASQRGRQADE